MENYKIRVNNEAESKEVQGLFFELGYKWFSGGNQVQHLKQSCSSSFGYLVAWSNGCFTNVIQCGRGDEDVKEITLGELRDMVVLKRNDRKDANVSEENCLYDLYLTESKELYFYHCGKNKWILSNLNGDDDYYESLKPIEKPMKEYLNKLTDGTYKLVVLSDLIDGHDGLIEVPEGANYAYNNDQGLCFLSGSLGDNHPLLIWQRHTQPEELPFVDDGITDCREAIQEIYKPSDFGALSLNDQYAEIEQVRKEYKSNHTGSDLPDFSFEDTVNHPSHNHYFIDVSDVDEVDFYEIALRYNVTDPCIQHILKKCLAVGNRGHKDFHTDLKDIYDTAARALRIHGG